MSNFKPGLRLTLAESNLSRVEILFPRPGNLARKLPVS
jgi:hypothetical protein